MMKDIKDSVVVNAVEVAVLEISHLVTILTLSEQKRELGKEANELRLIVAKERKDIKAFSNSSSLTFKDSVFIPGRAT